MLHTTLASARPFPAAYNTAARGALLDFFSSACKLKATDDPGTTYNGSGAAVMSIMSFFGDPVWSFALVMPESTAVAAAKGFAGFDIPFDSADMGDLVGEMANVMAGDVVARLEAARLKAKMSLPTVARGHDVELLPASNVSEVRQHFLTAAGGFQLRLFQAVISPPAGYRPG